MEQYLGAIALEASGSRGGEGSVPALRGSPGLKPRLAAPPQRAYRGKQPPRFLHGNVSKSRTRFLLNLEKESHCGPQGGGLLPGQLRYCADGRLSQIAGHTLCVG
jgi:hypothetical protein